MATIDIPGISRCQHHCSSSQCWAGLGLGAATTDNVHCPPRTMFTAVFFSVSIQSERLRDLRVWIERVLQDNLPMIHFGDYNKNLFHQVPDIMGHMGCGTRSSAWKFPKDAPRGPIGPVACQHFEYSTQQFPTPG